jgi:2-keto-3-deoxy-L-rhamnonate aldolase RhmA
MADQGENMRDFQLGMFQNLPNPMVSRYLAQLGWQWIILDLQHTSLDFSVLYECIHVIRTAGSLPFVRVGIGAFSDINRVLDLGAAGVVVPMTNCREDAERAAAAAKYPPRGERSIGGDPWYHYGSEYPRTANRETRLFIQMEHFKAAECITDMLAVDGVDGCYVGPSDLALSLELPHDDFETNPRHKAAIQRTLDACREYGKIAATNTYSLKDAMGKASQGFEWITMRSDMDLFIDAAKQQLTELRETVNFAATDQRKAVKL